MKQHSRYLTLIIFLIIPLITMAQSIEIITPFEKVPFASVLALYNDYFGKWENQDVDDNKFQYAVIRVRLEGNQHKVLAAKKYLGLYLDSKNAVEYVIKDIENTLLFLVPSSVKSVYITCGQDCSQCQIISLNALEPDAVYEGKVHFIPAKNDMTTIMSPNTGSLKVIGAPVGAMVKIDNENIGTAPLVINGLLQGVHFVAIEHNDYVPFNCQVVIEEGQLKDLNYVLAETPEYLLSQALDYYNGTNGKSEDLKLSFSLFHKSAEQGNADAQYFLAFSYYYGNVLPQNYQEAIKWFQLAAAQGHLTSQTFLAAYYFYAQDYAEAVKWFRNAAEQGEVTAQYNLGRCYCFGNGVPQDYEQAAFWYRKAAEAGYANAQRELGVFYMHGYGVPQNHTEAFIWFRKAAEQNNVEALFSLGVCHDEGYGVTQNHNEAINWYRKAAENGYAEAQHMLGLCYMSGNYVAQDYAQAAFWHHKAAEQGHARAQSELASCYEEGNGVPQDYEQAAFWYKASAEQGWDDAQYHLGSCYEKGRGVPQDYTAAFNWYRKAAEQGHAQAQVAVGECYHYGKGVNQDDDEALKWYRLSIEEAK